MRQKNDGRGRLGGRTAGTPNKITGTLKEWLASLIESNKEQIEKDLKTLEPKERLLIIEKLMHFIIAKPKTEVEITENKTNGTGANDEFYFDFETLPEELLLKIADHIQDARYEYEIQRKLNK